MHDGYPLKKAASRRACDVLKIGPSYRSPPTTISSAASSEIRNIAKKPFVMGSTSSETGDNMPAPIDSEAVTTSSLQALQSADQRKVMDIVDKLRRTGLNGIVELPQLVVCGDQSSGKSSVLEAITEIPFPRKENLCTRFATEVIKLLLCLETKHY